MVKISTHYNSENVVALPHGRYRQPNYHLKRVTLLLINKYNNVLSFSVNWIKAKEANLFIIAYDCMRADRTT